MYLKKYINVYFKNTSDHFSYVVVGPFKTYILYILLRQLRIANNSSFDVQCFYF